MKFLDFKEVTLQNFKKVPSQDRHKKLWHQGIIQLTFHHSQRKDLVVSTLLCNYHKWTCFPLKYHWELQNENHRKAVVITHVPLMNNLETEHQMYKCHAWFKAFIFSLVSFVYFMEQKEEFKVMQTHGNYQAVQENQKQQDAKNKVKVPLNPETCEIPKNGFY